MPALFLSHASEDDAATSALEAWLLANGFTDIFVDHHSFAGGEKWREALRASAGACRVVVCLVSEHWLASHECFNEFRAAWYMGKRIIPLFMLSPARAGSAEAGERLAEVCAEDQGIDLAHCFDANGTLALDAHPETASRLKLGLRAAGAISRIGLDPQAFAIDARLRPTPFPGLASFGDDDADAALFYGRSREIAETLEELRKVRAERDLRPFVILGASGAGKSSLLKAGIIPRLRREPPAWLPLRAFRPGADPLLNFAEALSRTLADFGKIEAYGVIRDRLLEAWSAAERSNGELTTEGLARIEKALEAEGRKLREAAGRPAASILVGVDQAEEMARASSSSSADALADYLRLALASEQQLAARLHHPHRQPCRAAKPSPFPGPAGARLRPPRNPGGSLRHRGRGARQTLRRRGRQCAGRRADGGRAERGLAAAPGLRPAAAVAPVRCIGRTDQRQLRQGRRPARPDRGRIRARIARH
jgi:hypothetical protein